MRLIDAEPIMKFIQDGLNSGEFGYDQIKVMGEIQYAPIVDAKPVVHGRWVLKDYGWYCSECGQSLYKGFSNFCPNCGADMKEEICTKN